MIPEPVWEAISYLAIALIGWWIPKPRGKKRTRFDDIDRRIS